MNTKLLTSMGCLLLMVAANAPSVLGHSERPSIVGDLGSGYAGPGSGVANTVSGRYVGAYGPAVAIEGAADPQWTIATVGNMMCDAEVAVDGQYVGNEVNIDGVGPGATGGSVPDTWDDGGLGGACHTGHYTTPGFNTFGCQTGTQVSGGTHIGTDIWVGAACDWKTDLSEPTREQALTRCLTNGIRAFNPLGNLVTEVMALADCTLAFVDCLFAAFGCLPYRNEACGFDGIVDAIDYGYAGAGATIQPATFPPATGIFYVPYLWLPSDPRAAPCPAGNEVARIFVFDTVATNGGNSLYPGNVEIDSALTGEVFSVPSMPSTPPPLPPPCNEATAANPAVVQLVCSFYYYPPGGYYLVCMPWASTWNPATATSTNSCPYYTVLFYAWYLWPRL